MGDRTGPVGIDELEPLPSGLEEVAADLRASFMVEPEPSTVARHLSAMREAVPSETQPRRRSRIGVAALAATASLVLTSFLAAAGALPPPLQRELAHLAHGVGISVPGGADDPSRAPATRDVHHRAPPPTSASRSGESVPVASPTSVVASAGVGSHPSTSTTSVSAASPTVSVETPTASTTTTAPGRSGTAPGHDAGAGNNRPAEPPGQAKKAAAGADTAAHGRAGDHG
jgi:hypothetical protein